VRQGAAAVPQFGEEAVDGGGVGDAGGHRELVGGGRGCATPITGIPVASRTAR
jgi:hypothetical protein